MYVVYAVLAVIGAVLFFVGMGMVGNEKTYDDQVPGINQIGVNLKSGLTFATGLRSILRADPDIVMVGEIRDAETAKIAIEAALTGHLVLSTLHTNDAPSAITRLTEMGIEPFLTASAAALVIGDRQHLQGERLLFHGDVSVRIGSGAADDADIDRERAVEEEFLAVDLDQPDQILLGAFVDLAAAMTRIDEGPEPDPGDVSRPAGGDVAEQVRNDALRKVVRLHLVADGKAL